MDLELISREGGAGPLPAARPAVLRRGAVRPGRGPRRPDRGHPRLRQVRPAGRRGGPPAHAGRRARRSGRTGRGTSGSRAATSIHAEHVVNAGGLWAREVGRMVGHRAAGPRDGAPLPPDRGHARGRRARREDRPRDADGARLRRRDLHPPGGRRDAPRHLRAGVRAVVAARDAVGLRVAAPQARPRPDHARAVGRVQALPADGHDRHQAGSSTGRSRSHPMGIRWSARSAACAATGSPAASWPGCRRAAASASRWRPG